MTEIPTMTPVESSNVESVGHNAATNELHVIFKSGGHYVYRSVPPAVHVELLKADSIGRFIGQHIKGKFDHWRLS